MLCCVTPIVVWLQTFTMYTLKFLPVVYASRNTITQLGNEADVMLCGFVESSSDVMRASSLLTQVNVREGAAAELVESMNAESGPGQHRAVYELFAAVHHVKDTDEEPGKASAAEGHLIAHIQVPNCASCWRFAVPLLYTMLSGLLA